MSSPRRLLVERVGRLRGERCLVVAEARSTAVDDRAAASRRGHGRAPRQHAGLRRGAHDRSSAAIVEDVADLLRGEVGVDRGDVEPGPQRRPDHLEVARVVLHEDGHVVADAAGRAPARTGRAGWNARRARGSVTTSPDLAMMIAGFAGVDAAVLPGYTGPPPRDPRPGRMVHETELVVRNGAATVFARCAPPPPTSSASTFPIFAFSHCRDVVAAVTNAGGCGVLGAVAHSPEQLDIDLDLDRGGGEGQAVRRRPARPREVRRRGGGRPRRRRPSRRCSPTSTGAGSTTCSSATACRRCPADDRDPSAAAVRRHARRPQEHGAAARRRSSPTDTELVASALGPPPAALHRAGPRRRHPGRRAGRLGRPRRPHTPTPAPTSSSPRAPRPAATPARSRRWCSCPRWSTPWRRCRCSPPAASAAAGSSPPAWRSAPTACGAARCGSPPRRPRRRPSVKEKFLAAGLRRHGPLPVDHRQAGPDAAHRVDRRVGAARRSRARCRCRSSRCSSARRMARIHRVAAPRRAPAPTSSPPTSSARSSARMNTVQPDRPGRARDGRGVHRRGRAARPPRAGLIGRRFSASGSAGCRGTACPSPDRAPSVGRGSARR